MRVRGFYLKLDWSPFLIRIYSSPPSGVYKHWLIKAHQQRIVSSPLCCFNFLFLFFKPTDPLGSRNFTRVADRCRLTDLHVVLFAHIFLPLISRSSVLFLLSLSRRQCPFPPFAPAGGAMFSHAVLLLPRSVPSSSGSSSCLRA